MNKKIIEIEERKKIEFEILKYVKKICDDNNLRYYLYYGTLLGAVRHKGFIPWDDDIDIAIMYDDYMKLIEIMKNDKKYLCLNPYNCEDYYYQFVKIVDPDTIIDENDFKPIKNMGINIDIFPICKVPDNEKERIKFVNKLKKMKENSCRNIWSKKYYYSKSKIKSIVKLFYYFPSYLYTNAVDYNKKIFKLIEKYKDYDTNYLAILPTFNGAKDINAKKCFDEIVYLDFEGEKFAAPAGYDEILENSYGDYMKLPHESQRVAPHNSKAYYK